MTWLSRLLPQGLGLQRLAAKNHNIRSRQSLWRRRMMTLESLEHRTLLSNVVATIVTATGGAKQLDIMGDAGSDSFSITENRNGTVTLVGIAVGTGSLIKTEINYQRVGTPYTTSQAVEGIVVTLPGNSNNTDQVVLTGPGKNVSTTVRNVSVTVTGASPHTQGERRCERGHVDRH